jgi:hypothetical protein
MANLLIGWVLPTVRDSGRPLPVEQIAHVEIDISADGVNFAALGPFLPDVLATEVSDLDIGQWLVRGIVVDTKGRRSDEYISSVEVEDDSAPGMLNSLTLTLS